MICLILPAPPFLSPPADEVISEPTMLDSQDTADDSDAKSALKKLRSNNVVRMTIGYLNINLNRIKFDQSKETESLYSNGRRNKN